MENTASKLEKLLVQTQLVSPSLLAIAQRDAKTRGTRLGPALIDLGLVEEARFAEWVAALAGTAVLTPVPAADVARHHQRVPRSIAREFEVVPISVEGEVLTVAMLNPLDSECLEVLRTSTGLKIHPMAALHSDLTELVTVHYPEEAAEPAILPVSAPSEIAEPEPETPPLPPETIEEKVADLQKRVEALERLLENAPPR